MTSHPLPPPYYDLPAYDDAVIGNRLQQVEKRLQKHIADVLKHNDVAVSEKAQQMVSNILLIYEKRFDDLGGEVRQKMDAFKDWASRLGTGEQTLIEMDKKLAKIHDKVEELDAFHAVIKRHEEREKNIHSDLLSRIKALEEKEEKNHDVLIDEGVMRHIEKMVETRMRGQKADAGIDIDIDIDALFDDSKLTPEEIEDIQKILSIYIVEFKKYNNYQPIIGKPPTILINNLFQFLTKNKETVFLSTNMHLSAEDKDKPLIHWPVFIFTNKNIYFIGEYAHIISRIRNDEQHYKQDSKTMGHLGKSYEDLKEKSKIYVKQHINDTHEICLLYTFKEPLNFSMMKYIRDTYLKRRPDQHIQVFVDVDKKEVRERVGYINFLQNIDVGHFSPKVEQVMRIIPGSYQNGDWVALGGFFGMYFNKKTLEISEGPPPMPI